MQYLKWLTPRIRFYQITDDLGYQFVDIAYNVWDIKTKEPFENIFWSLQNKQYQFTPYAPYREVPTNEEDTEERHFFNLITRSLETEIDVKHPDKQFIRNVGMLWHHCPEIEQIVKEDVWEFLQEDLSFRKEWDTWYRQSLYDAYRKPHFYRDDLATKIPMRDD